MQQKPGRVPAKVLQQAVEAASIHKDDQELVRALLVAGMYPGVAWVRQARRGAVKKVEQLSNRKFWRMHTLQDGFVDVLASSIVCPFVQPQVLGRRWLVYGDKVKMPGNDVGLRDCTSVSDLAVMLFAGQLYADEKQPGVLRLNEHLGFQLTMEAAAMVLHLHQLIDHLLDSRVGREAAVSIGDGVLDGSVVDGAVVGLSGRRWSAEEVVAAVQGVLRGGQEDGNDVGYMWTLLDERDREAARKLRDRAGPRSRVLKAMLMGWGGVKGVVARGKRLKEAPEGGTEEGEGADPGEDAGEGEEQEGGLATAWAKMEAERKQREVAAKLNRVLGMWEERRELWEVEEVAGIDWNWRRGGSWKGQ